MDFDTQTGISAMQKFHNYSTVYSSYGMSWDQFKSAYGSKFEIYAEGIGLAINSTGASDSDVDDAMSTLAKQAKGRLPKDHQEYIKAIGGVVSQINYLDLTKTVATDTAIAVGDGLVKVGESVKTSLSWLLTALPFLVIGGAALWVFTKTGGTELSTKVIMAKVKKAAAKVAKK